MTRPLDRATIHAKALRAAAAVAFGTAGCGATTDAGPAGAAAEVQSDAAVESADAAGRAADAGSVTGADAAADTGTDAVADAGTDAAAETGAGTAADTGGDAIAAADSAGDGRPDCSKPPARGDGECCQKLTTWCENAYPKDSKAQSDCVWGPDFNGSTGCIPWGPPAPPEWSGVRVQGLA